MHRLLLVVTASLLTAFAPATYESEGLPPEAKKRLEYAVGRWNSRTESLGPGGEVRSTSTSWTERSFAIDGRVIQITGVDENSGHTFLAWEYYEEATGLYCLTSIGRGGRLTTMKGELGEVFQWQSEGRETADGGSYVMRFTHTDIEPDSFTALGEYSTDGGRSWTPFSRQYLTRDVADDATAR